MRTKITLECTECKQRNYNTTKDKKTHPDRVETKKYCKFCQKHTLHKETKQSIGGGIMAEAKKKSGLKNWFTGLKAEFSKIIWPDRQSLTKETVAVLAVSVLLGVIIAVVDLIVRFGIEFIVK